MLGGAPTEAFVVALAAERGLGYSAALCVASVRDGGALTVEEHRLDGRSRCAYGPQHLAQESGLGCETDVGWVEAAGGVEPDRRQLGIPDALVALDDDRVAVLHDEELPERRPVAGHVDDDAVARLQLGRHGVALRLEDADARRVGVALVEEEWFGKPPGCALRRGVCLGDGARVGAGVDGDLGNRDKRTLPWRVASCARRGRAPAGSRDEVRRDGSPEACRASRCPGTPAPPASRGAGIAGDRSCSCRWRRIRGPVSGNRRSCPRTWCENFNYDMKTLIMIFGTLRLM